MECKTWKGGDKMWIWLQWHCLQDFQNLSWWLSTLPLSQADSHPIHLSLLQVSRSTRSRSIGIYDSRQCALQRLIHCHKYQSPEIILPDLLAWCCLAWANWSGPRQGSLRCVSHPRTCILWNICEWIEQVWQVADPNTISMQQLLEPLMLELTTSWISCQVLIPVHENISFNFTCSC